MTSQLSLTSICVLVKFSPVTSFLQLKSNCAVRVTACMPLFGQLQAHVPKRFIKIHNYETNMVLHDSYRKTLGGGGNRSRHSNSLYKPPLRQWKIAAQKSLQSLNLGCSSMQSLFLLKKRIELPSESKGAVLMECNTQWNHHFTLHPFQKSYLQNSNT
jgi:hypothetical protein